MAWKYKELLDEVEKLQLWLKLYNNVEGEDIVWPSDWVARVDQLAAVIEAARAAEQLRQEAQDDADERMLERIIARKKAERESLKR